MRSLGLLFVALMVGCVSGADTAPAGDSSGDSADASADPGTADSDAEDSGAGSDGTDDAAIFGELEDDSIGDIVAPAGDVQGDGLADFWIFSKDRAPPTAYLFQGPVRGAVSAADADARVTDAYNTLMARHGAYTTLTRAGDLDSDGLDDLLIGSPVAGDGDEGQGGAIVMFGPFVDEVDVRDSDALLTNDEAGAGAGKAVAGVGDRDEDGWADLLIGSPGAAVAGAMSALGDCPGEDLEGDPDTGGIEVGEVYLILGPITGDRAMSSADATITGEDGYDHVGVDVTRVGDLDGDGIPDLLIGAPGQCEGGYFAGAVYLVTGPTAGTLSLADADGKIVGAEYDDSVGSSVAGDADVNGDGHPDILLGTPGADAGQAWLVLGPALGKASLTAAEASFEAEGPTTYAGDAVAMGGDVDGDGFGELLVGDIVDDEGGRSAGAAYVVRGPVSGAQLLADADLKVTGTDHDYVGYDLTGLGDTDGDGLSDLLIGAPWDSTSATHAGAVMLLSSGGATLAGLGS